MDRTIDLLKEANARIKALEDDFELAMKRFREGEASFREGFALLAKHMGKAPSVSSGSPLPVLTESEKEVFLMIGQKLDGQAIAEHLKISLKTFHRHRDNIRKKLNLENSWELAQVARKEFSQLDAPQQQ